nr:MAG: replication associated protein [Cressdnaviricota sp.]
MQAKAFIGTSYDLSLSFVSEKIAYAIWQKELCPATSREHLQFFLMTVKKTRFQGLRSIIGTAHVEAAKDVEKSILYCSKQETRISGPWEVGLRPKSKESMVAMLQKRKISEILMEQPMLWRNVRQLQACKACVARQRTEGPRVCLMLTGPTGKGKTTIAMRIAAFVGDTYYKGPKHWWDGYEGNQLVIWDEFRDVQVEAPYLLSLINQAPFKGEIKGGTVEINSAGFIFTSNYRLEDMFLGLDHSSREALNRRIKELYIYC